MAGKKAEILDEVDEVVLKIQGGQSKVGTAIEAYDTRYLWDLGELIRTYSSVSGSEEKAIEEIMEHSDSGLVHFQPALLKKAETARRAFTTREEYLELAKVTTYGKLREVLTVFDPDFAAQQHVPAEELVGLKRKLPLLTYEETRGEVRRIREKYNPSGISIDYDELWEDMESAIAALGAMIANKDKAPLKRYRSEFGPALIQNNRRLMAAMADEENFRRLVPDLPKKFGQNVDTSVKDLRGNINRVIYSLSLLRQTSEERREVLRKRVGKMLIGELSTLMKAAGSDEEMERYLRSRRIMEKLRVP